MPIAEAMLVYEATGFRGFMHERSILSRSNRNVSDLFLGTLFSTWRPPFRSEATTIRVAVVFQRVLNFCWEVILGV